MGSEPDEAIEPKVVMQLGIAAAANALAIVEEANLLAQDGHEARAFSLSVLATEELSKAWAALVAGIFPGDPEIGPELRKIVLGHHRVKVDASLFLERDVPKLAGLEPDAMAGELDGVLSEDVYAEKNAGMYVDLDGDQVRGPERIGPDEIALGKKLRKMVIAWGVILQGTLEHDLECTAQGATSTHLVDDGEARARPLDRQGLGRRGEKARVPDSGYAWQGRRPAGSQAHGRENQVAGDTRTGSDRGALLTAGSISTDVDSGAFGRSQPIGCPEARSVNL